MTQYTHYAVVGKCTGRYGTQFLRYAGAARKTPKRVFVAGVRWGEIRYDPARSEIWLFGTEKEAVEFRDRHNKVAGKAEYAKRKAAYENASEVSKSKLAEISKTNPPLSRGAS